MINLWTHQQAAVDKVATVGSMGLWMGMRTGKTTTSLSIAKKYNLFPCLVISPLSVIHTWQNDWAMLTGSEEDFQVVTDRNHLMHRRPKVFCLNYEKAVKMDPLGVRAVGPAMKPKAPGWADLPDFKSVFIDESYRIANWDNNITQYLLQWDIPDGQFRFCLSGSPASEDAYNMATQYVFMRRDIVGCKSVAEYLKKHWTYCSETYKWSINDPRHVIDVRNHMQKFGFCVTMKQLGLGSFVIPSRHRFDLNQKQIDLLKHLKHSHIYKHKTTGEECIMYPMTRVLFERKIAAGVDPFTDEIINTVKMDHVLQMHKDRPEEGLLVVSVFTAPIIEMYNKAVEKGIPCALIYGNTKTDDREEFRKQFQEGKIKMIFAQTKTVYVGLKFSALTKIVVYANDYSQDVRSQLEQRGNATDRPDPYEVVDLLSRGTVEEDVLDCLVIKKKNASFYMREMNQTIVNRKL